MTVALRRSALAYAALLPLLGTSQAAGAPSSERAPILQVCARDADGAALASVALTLRLPNGMVAATGLSDARGCSDLAATPGVAYRVEAARAGYAPVALEGVRMTDGPLALVIPLQSGFREAVDVVGAAVGGDASPAHERLTARDLVDLPFAGARDFRRALPLLPGVLEDVSGQLHIAGSAPEQVLFLLDGFDVGDPATGALGLRLAPEALRAVEVQRGRYLVEHSRGSAGVVSLETTNGNNQARLAVTDFLPSLNRQAGWRLNNWTPRLAWSGPLRRERVWFALGAEAEYDQTLIPGAPADANRSSILRLGQMAKLQIAAGPGHLVSATYAWNFARADNEDLTRFDPLETTLDRKTTLHFAAVRDQIAWPNGTLIELGLAAQRVRSRDEPLGTASYVLFPGSSAGNFYRWSERRADRLQALARVTLPAREWHGRHQVRVGFEAKPMAYFERVERRPITILGEDGTLERTIEFVDRPEVRRTHIETGTFVQDRWSLAERALVELGLRADWDSVVHQLLLAPRVAAAWRAAPGTRLTAGLGVFHDSIPLGTLALPATGRRADVFYSLPGQPAYRIETILAADEAQLRSPRALAWSLGVEKRLTRTLVANVEYHARYATNGLTFLPPGASSDPSGGLPVVRALGNARQDRFDGVELSLRQSLGREHSLFFSYGWSQARTNAAFDFDLDMPVLGAQSPAPLAWDARHRLLSHGFLPLRRGLDLAFTLEWRSGFPFTLTDAQQVLVERPNSEQLPAFFALNVHGEQRFHLLGARWALRLGVNDLTNHVNAWIVDHNVDSPTFLARDRTQRRGFVARVRFLGRR